MTGGPGEAARVDLPRQLARRLLPAAVAVAVLIGIVAPALVWYFQVEAARQTAEVHAHDFERHLQSFVLDNGPLWRYQAQKYVETLRRFVPEKNIRRIGVSDEHGTPMPLLHYVAEPVAGEWPDVPIQLTLPVRFNNRLVAHVVMEVSTAHATASAVRLFLLLAAVGITFGLFMFALPVSVARRLDRRVQQEMRARTALYLAAEAHLEQTRQLAVVTREVASTLDPSEAAACTVTSAEALFGARAVRLWRIDAEAPQAPVVAVGAAAAADDRTLVAAVLATCNPRRQPAAGGGERWIVPLLAGQQCAGALEIVTAGIVDAAEAELIGLFASKVAIALVNCDLHDGLRRALKQVTEQNAELDSFVHTVSHDLKAPLIAIRGFAGALADALPAGGDTQVAHYVERIGANADKMSRLLRDLLELSQIGRAGRAAEAVALGPIVEGVLADLQEAIDARGVTVVIGELGEVWGVRAELQSVVQNLVGNAVKYLGDTPAPRIEIGRRLEKEVPEFFVRDNGIGIDPAYHDKVFRLFERLHDVPAPGTGVGLAIVRRIVDRAGGHVRLESERGRGATFSFTWPRPAAACTLAPAPVAP
jgi:signal transduction histidine kinase